MSCTYILAVLTCAGALQVEVSQVPHASDLLDKYAVAQDRLKSFIMQYETSTILLPNLCPLQLALYQRLTRT